MKSKRLIKLVTAAMFAALTCISTMVIPIPSPTGGYIHPGDGFVILSGIILGPFFGGLAAGIGSMFADIFLGYSEYAIATLIIKALSAVVAVIIYRHLPKRKLSIIIAGIFAEFIVTTGYFITESIFSGSIAAGATGIPHNLVQNIFGIVVASLLLPLLLKVPQVKSMVKDK